MDTLFVVGLVLLVMGFVLVGTEMILPGFGVPGIGGIVCLVAGVFFTADTVEEGLTITVIVVVILAIMFTVIMSLFHMRKMKAPIILNEELNAEKGYLSDSDLEYMLGKEGMAETDLRPAGKCDFDGVEFDVRTEGKYICKGTKVKVIKLKENTLIVKNII